MGKNVREFDAPVEIIMPEEAKEKMISKVKAVLITNKSKVRCFLITTIMSNEMLDLTT